MIAHGHDAEARALGGFLLAQGERMAPGDRDGAVALPSATLAAGQRWRMGTGYWAFHTMTDLRPLHGHPPFEALMRVRD